LSGIERLNPLNIKNDSGQAGMKKLITIIAGVIVAAIEQIKRLSTDNNREQVFIISSLLKQPFSNVIHSCNIPGKE
jgi:hypothetical protein